MNREYSNIDDFQLIEDLRKSNHRAFTEIFNRFKEPLYRHAYRMIPDDLLCNDLIQDVFLSLWNNRLKIKINKSISAYLFQSVKNRILNYISHEVVVGKYLDEIKSFEENCDCFTEKKVLERELLGLIEKSKLNLPDKMRKIYELHKEQHYSYKEIGEKLLISEKTVKKQVHNALKILRSKLTYLFFFFF